jgi:hypothetical protein
LLGQTLHGVTVIFQEQEDGEAEGCTHWASANNNEKNIKAANAKCRDTAAKVRGTQSRVYRQAWRQSLGNCIEKPMDTQHDFGSSFASTLH